MKSFLITLSKKSNLNCMKFVIPAKAGIQIILYFDKKIYVLLDPRFRGDDTLLIHFIDCNRTRRLGAFLLSRDQLVRPAGRFGQAEMSDEFEDHPHRRFLVHPVTGGNEYRFYPRLGPQNPADLAAFKI